MIVMDAFKILIVEDNIGDVLMITEALEDSKYVTQQWVVSDGKKALDFLLKQNSYITAETPDLVLLDYNIPKYNGLEVLKIIKNDEVLKTIPVVIFTTSYSKFDVIKCYENHVNCYITKPQDGPDFINAVAKIEEFWIDYVNSPSSTRP